MAVCGSLTVKGTDVGRIGAGLKWGGPLEFMGNACDVGKWRVSYSENEFCAILEGKCVLTDAAGRSLRKELIEFIKDLDVDEAAALVALAWIGRGDMEPEEWKIAVAQAKERAEAPTWRYVLDMELLPDYLEDALSAFGRSCEGLGSADEG